MTMSAVRDSVFKRDVNRHKHSSLQLDTQSRGTSTVRCAAIKRIARSARLNRVQTYCEQGSLPMLSANGRDWHPRQQGGEQSKCLRSSLSCEASAATLWAHVSFASPLRLSGEAANRPIAGEAALSYSIHREAPAVKAHERAAARPRQPCRELERGVRVGACGGYALLGVKFRKLDTSLKKLKS